MRYATAITLTLTIWVGSASAQQEPTEVFQALDANNDGQVTSNEVPEAQRPYFERVLRIGDRDEDGVISREEFVAALRPEPPPAVGNGFDGDRQGPPRRGDSDAGFINGSLVDRFDQNDDGKLTLDEVPQPLQRTLRPVFERTGREELTREDLNRMAARQLTGFLERLDTNDDGKLALSELPEPLQRNWKPIFDRAESEELSLDRLRELLAERGRMQRPDDTRRPDAGRTQDLDALFRQRDANGDGQLSREEARLQAGFDRLDRNGDGQLTRDELQQARPRPRSP